VRRLRAVVVVAVAVAAAVALVGVRAGGEAGERGSGPAGAAGAGGTAGPAQAAAGGTEARPARALPRRVRRIRHRYAFSSGHDPRAARAVGWTLIDVDKTREAAALPAGTRALLWLGNYDNDRCTWEYPDAWLRRKLAETAREPKVAGYFFSDEPDPVRCPAAPAQHRARSRLIRRLDPRAFTVMVADANEGEESLRQLRLWRGAADRVGLNPYICYRGRRCAFGWIDRVIAAADAAGLRYWGVVQAFADEAWRWPTPAELERMLAQWARSRWDGFMTFAWRWDGRSLADRPELLTVLRRINRALATGRDPGAWG
jgi:hypothetical protein